MRMKTTATLAALALAFTLGTASAAEKFTTLDGDTAEPMKAEEMAATTGQAAPVTITIQDNGALALLNFNLDLKFLFKSLALDAFDKIARC